MELSEKNSQQSLNTDSTFSFKPRNVQIDINISEEDEQLLKLRDLPRRKSSTGSTSTSKPEDPSDLFSFPNSPSNLTANSNKEYSSKNYSLVKIKIAQIFYTIFINLLRNISKKNTPKIKIT